MCLIIKPKQKALIAKKDITCFKVVCKLKSDYTYIDCRTYSKGTLITPYKESLVIPGSVVASEINIIPNYDKGCISIEQAIHSFTNEIVANDDCEFINSIWGDRVIAKVVECIIPKDSTYYIGDFEEFITGGYASDKLIYPKEIEI